MMLVHSPFSGDDDESFDQEVSQAINQRQPRGLAIRLLEAASILVDSQDPKTGLTLALQSLDRPADKGFHRYGRLSGRILRIALDEGALAMLSDLPSLEPKQALGIATQFVHFANRANSGNYLEPLPVPLTWFELLDQDQ